MKLSTIGTALILAAGMTAATLAYPQSATGGRVLELLQDSAVIKTKVLGIDTKTRILTVEGPAGPIAVPVSPKVQGLDKLKVGDTISVKYAEIYDIALKKGDGIAEGVVGRGTGFNKPGTMPATSNLAYVDTTLSVLGVEPAKRIVQVLAPNGAVVLLKVAPDVKGLDKLQKGDSIVVNFGEAESIQAMR